MKVSYEDTNQHLGEIVKVSTSSQEYIVRRKEIKERPNAAAAASATCQPGKK